MPEKTGVRCCCGITENVEKDLGHDERVGVDGGRQWEEEERWSGMKGDGEGEGVNPGSDLLDRSEPDMNFILYP